ncbi:MAG TPA: beta-galactosidase [Bryobacteraceae bacterium]|nr:beta-galactosidase [Bryobacteraceae bacterium]
MRAFVLLVALAAVASSAPPAERRREFVQAVEFPYYLYPHDLWERELVWLKTIGVRTVEFSIPWNWHQLRPDEFDFTGRTSPRRDLAGFIRELRKLGLQAWVRPLPPVEGLVNRGWPPSGEDGRAQQRVWLTQLEDLLATQTAQHGGPVAYVEGAPLAIDAAPPPTPVTVVSTTDAGALARSRDAMIAADGSLLWQGVEETVYPEGWEANTSRLIRAGAVDLNGHERPSTHALRRDAALLHNWLRLLPTLVPAAAPKPLTGKLPAGVTAAERISPAASVVSVTNRGSQTFHGDLRVEETGSRRTLVIPQITVEPGESLWLPVDVSLGAEGLCRECSNFSAAEHIVYATAELLAVEYENGILAMEFAAPQPGEVILQLAREPVGPFLAAGKPTKFDWDDKTLRARLPIPANTAPGNHVRIGLAMEAPETSAFFNDAKRLIIGRKNLVSTTYSSPAVAARSRLRLPEGFTATSDLKTPNEIEYQVDVPSTSLHGDWADFAIEADGMPLGRARLQLFRPVSIRMSEAIGLHFGPNTELPLDPPTAAIDPKAGRNLEIILRNNSPQIQTYHVEASGDSLEFFPAKTEISIGGMMERPVSLRVFARDGDSGVRNFNLRVRGGADADVPIRLVLVPRGHTVAWEADLDNDGSPEWILESAKVRAVFSTQDGGRWMEFTWKDTEADFLPEGGALVGTGPVSVRASGDELEITGRNWKRTVRLSDATLTIEQSTPLPPALAAETRGNVKMTAAAESPSRARYTLAQQQESDANPSSPQH